MVVDRKNRKALALLYLASGLLPNAANSSDVLTEFASEHNKAEVLKVKFRNLNFSPSTKTTTECSFELFLSIYRYDCFFFQV